MAFTLPAVKLHNRQRVDGVWRFWLLFGGGKAVGGQQTAFHRSLRRGRYVQPADARAVHNCGHLFGLELLRLLDAVGGRLPHAFQVKAAAFAQANHQHALRGNCPTRVKHAHLARLAGQVAAGNQLADGPTQRLVHRAGGPAGGGYVIKQIHDERIGRYALDFTLLYANFHMLLLQELAADERGLNLDELYPARRRNTRQSSNLCYAWRNIIHPLPSLPPERGRESAGNEGGLPKGDLGMKLLVIGGTRFLGRAIVNYALAAGHEVTLFNRGQSNPDLFEGEVETLVGNRDGGLGVLDGRSFTAVIDTCGYIPRLVRDSATRLKDAIEHYTFISTLSVYSDNSTPGQDESSPLGTLEDETVEEVTGETYGPLKVLCEKAASDVMGAENALHVRAGLIVGPHDLSDRFTYWPARVARGGEVLAPGTSQSILSSLSTCVTWPPGR
jgi:hypothetical protein